MQCKHREFTCTATSHGWKWECLSCGEKSRSYHQDQTECLMDITRMSRKIVEKTPIVN